MPYYLFSYPRITDNGVSFFLNTPSDSASHTPSSKEYAIPLSALDAVIDKDSACWHAMNGSGIGSLNSYSGYEDVAKHHWAYDAIKTVTAAADAGRLRVILTTIAEASAVLVRTLGLDTSSIAPPDGAPWQ